MNTISIQALQSAHGINNSTNLVTMYVPAKSNL